MVKNERKLDLISSRSSSSSSSSSSSYYATKHLNKFKKHQNQTNGQDHASTSKSASSFTNIEQQTNKTQQQQQQQNGIDWKITMLDGTQTVELNMSDEMGKQKKTHVCLFCGKIYNRKYGLKIHLRTHTGYKPLKCKVCSRPFSDPSNLNKHVRLHSQGDTPYRYLVEKFLFEFFDIKKLI
jgi:uncharacterized Zn-finger protein